jgi:hypothetical protein
MSHRLTTEILFVHQNFFPEKAAGIKESRIQYLHKAKRTGDRLQLAVKACTIEKRSQVRSARSIRPQSQSNISNCIISNIMKTIPLSSS